MPTQNKQTASFMVRFNQSIYDDSGEAVVQWRGKVSHVQDGDAVSFTDMSDAMSFIQDKLTELTKKATSDKYHYSVIYRFSKFHIWQHFFTDSSSTDWKSSNKNNV